MIPLVSPVAGHGCVSWNSRLTEADLCSLAEADNGIMTQPASVAKISKASGMPSPNLAPGSSAWRPARGDWPAVDLKLELVGLRGGSDE
jgi:hypothetical protein